MRKLVILSVFIFVAVCANAQGISRVRDRLAQPAAFTGASIAVTEQPDASEAIVKADRNGRQGKITCYHVSLFRDNSQSANANAHAVATQFKEIFSEIPVVIGYDSPYFRVDAGTFVDHLDAIALCGKVASKFPKAVVVRSEMNVSGVISRQKANSFGSSDEKIAKNVEN